MLLTVAWYQQVNMGDYLDKKKCLVSPRIAIVGGGIIGMSSAVEVKKAYPNAHVCVLTEKISPDTTADGSAGLWEPYLLGETPPELIQKWSLKTYELMKTLWKSESAGETGVTLFPLIWVTRNKPAPIPSWSDSVMGFQALNNEQLSSLNQKNGTIYKSGYSFITFSLEPKAFLPQLMKQFSDIGGVINYPVTVKSITELREKYDIIINCAGLDGGRLADDYSVTPIRGQVARVGAPWMTYGIIDDSTDGSFYILPNQKTVILGGTSQSGDWDLNVRKNDSDRIFTGCIMKIPGLKHAQIVKEWVGLRPGRYRVCLERKEITYSDGKKLQVIHNYGHGGSGVTMFYGCALDVVQHLNDILIPNFQRAKL